MTTQDVFFPIIAAIAGFIFGGTIGGAFLYGLARLDPDMRKASDFWLTVGIGSMFSCMFGLTTGIALNLFLYYKGVPLLYLLIVGFILAALSSLVYLEEYRWSSIKVILYSSIVLFVPIVSLIGLYLLYVSQPFPIR